MTDNQSKREELQDKLLEIREINDRLNAFAEQKHGEETKDKYREEYGEEMDEFDGNNLNDQAAIDAFNGEDFDAATDIENAIESLNEPVNNIDQDTSAKMIEAIEDRIGDVATKTDERRNSLGYNG
jgi:hypothetical protein